VPEYGSVYPARREGSVER